MFKMYTGNKCITIGKGGHNSRRPVSLTKDIIHFLEFILFKRNKLELKHVKK